MKRSTTITLFLAATLITAGGAFASEGGRAGQDASTYGTSSSDMTRSGQSESAAGQSREQSGQSASSQQQGQQSASIQAADDLKNFTVQDTRGEEIGRVSEVLVDLESGRIGYAVVRSGGFLGMGGERYIIPFNALRTGENNQTLTLGIQKDQLQQAPRGDAEQVSDRETGREIHQFYGVSPYWEEGGSQSEPQSSGAGQQDDRDDDEAAEESSSDRNL